MNKFIAVLSMSLALVVSGNVSAAGDIAKGKASATKKGCMGCHGADGNSFIAANPKLAGQSVSYMVKQLKDFKSKKRLNVIMSGQAAGLSDEEMLNISAYFAAQAPKAGLAKQEIKELGKRIYIGGNKKSGVPACIGCHGPVGEGNDAAMFPSLGGQHEAYTVNQLKLFRTAGLVWLEHKNAGTNLPEKRDGRTNDKGAKMQAAALRLTDAEIKAVASYLQGLRLRK